MKNHLKILGIFYFAFGLLGAVIAVLLFLVKTGRLFLPAKMSMFANAHGYASVIALLFALISLPAIITGIALLMRKFWASFSALVLAFLSLFIIPLGTALGIYAIWVLVNTPTFSELDSEVDESMLPRVFPPYH
ncbi:MAG: hypothetical protein ACREOI_26705 [bacterium]